MNKNQKGFTVVEVLLLLAIISLVAFVGWRIYDTQTSKNENSNQANTSEANKSAENVDTSPLKPQDVTEKIKSEYATKYKILDLQENNQPQEGEMAIGESDFAPAYKSEGYQYYTNQEGGSALTIVVGPAVPGYITTAREIDENVRTEVAQIYTDLGLAKTGAINYPYSGYTDDVYTGKGLVCTINSPTTTTGSVDARCGSIEAYKEAAAKVESISKVIPGVTDKTVLSSLKIRDSQTSGYQKAEVGQGDIEGGGSIALLYKKGDEGWVYFRNAQNAFACTEYNTVDLRNAFKGDPCYDENDQQITVQ